MAWERLEAKCVLMPIHLDLNPRVGPEFGSIGTKLLTRIRREAAEESHLPTVYI